MIGPTATGLVDDLLLAIPGWMAWAGSAIFIKSLCHGE